MTAWAIAVGRMLGLGTIAGIRPSLTLAVIGAVTYLDWGVPTNATFAFLGHWQAIGIFVVLAILESTFDKIAKLDRIQDRLIMPYRMVMGGVAGAATIPFGWQGVVIGAAVGAGAAWFSQYTKHMSRPRSVTSEAVVTLISAAEDLGAFIGAALVLAVPYAGYACVAVTGVLYWRARDSHHAKYRRMRRAARRQGAPAVVATDGSAPRPETAGGPAATSDGVAGGRPLEEGGAPGDAP